MSLAAGTRLGPYEILAPMGAGGMGEVYRARDTRLERTVAIKVLPEHLAESPERKARFEREAKAISQLNHPNICTLHDIGEQDGTDYLVMEYIEGETLADRLKKGRLKLDQALEVGIQIANGLDKAHRAGIVHRDLKPGNIMLTKSGVKLLDFGLAKARWRPDAVSDDSDAPRPSRRELTQRAGRRGNAPVHGARSRLEGGMATLMREATSSRSEQLLYEMLDGEEGVRGRESVRGCSTRSCRRMTCADHDTSRRDTGSNRARSCARCLAKRHPNDSLGNPLETLPNSSRFRHLNDEDDGTAADRRSASSLGAVGPLHSALFCRAARSPRVLMQRGLGIAAVAAEHRPSRFRRNHQLRGAVTLTPDGDHARFRHLLGRVKRRLRCGSQPGSSTVGIFATHGRASRRSPSPGTEGGTAPVFSPVSPDRYVDRLCERRRTVYKEGRRSGVGRPRCSPKGSTSTSNRTGAKLGVSRGRAWGAIVLETAGDSSVFSAERRRSHRTIVDGSIREGRASTGHEVLPGNREVQSLLRRRGGKHRSPRWWRDSLETVEIRTVHGGPLERSLPVVGWPPRRS